MGDITLELVEDLLYGLHMRLQVGRVVGRTGRRFGQDGAQVKAQDAVDGLASEIALRGEKTEEEEWVCGY